MHRFVSITSLPVLLALPVIVGCPPQEEPVHVGKVEAKAQPASPTPPAAAPTRPEPEAAEPEAAEPEAAAGSGSEGSSADGPAPVVEPAAPELDPAGKQPQNTGHSPKPAPSKPDSAAAAVDGKTIFMKKCKTCHGEDGKADTKMGHKHDIPDMTAADWDRKWPRTKIIQLVREGKSGTKMKAFRDKLSAEEIEAVAAFTRSL